MHPRIVRDAYHILGVPTTASIDEIRQAYRELALKWHPDRHIDDKEHATKVFFEVSRAYQTLAGELEFPSIPAVSDTSSLTAFLPQSAPLASAESTTSIASSSQIFAIRTSNLSSPPTTPSSSLGESVKVQSEPSTREPYASWKRDTRRSPISASELEVTDSSGRSEVLIGRRRTVNSRASPRNHLEFKAHQRHPKQRVDTFPIRGAPGNAYARPTLTGEVPREVTPMAQVMDDPMAIRAGPPLQPLGAGSSREWIYPLTLALEELFSGKHCHFGIVRRMNSGKERNVVVELDIPPGCQRGTRILCRGVGHELPDGSLQDIVFVIEEAIHDRFTRLKDDLFLDLRMPWTDDFRRQPKRVGIRGLDGEELSIYIEYARDKVLTGSHGIRGAGMPIRRQGEVRGRGNLIVRWEIQPPQTRIRAFFGRFFHPRKGFTV